MTRTRRRRTGQRGGTASLAQRDRTPVVIAVVGVVLAILVGCTADSGRTSEGANTPPTTLALGTTTPAETSPASPTRSPRPSPTPSPRPSRTPPPRPTPTPSPRPAPRPSPGTARAVLGTLLVKGRAPKTGYSREQFGQAWSDDGNVPYGHDGCDTRNDILRRDLTRITLKPDTNGCVVERGRLVDPYTATVITFVRGVDTSSLVQIDHVVALSDAWQKGAQRQTIQRRIDFANDPLNLLAVDGAANQQKGDGDAATWLPPNRSFWCDYVARQIAVKRKYELWVTAAEKAAMQRVLSRCPDKRVPTEGTRPNVRPTRTQAPPRPRPTAPPPRGGGHVYYANCDAVRAAGRAPLYRGQPGYRPELDRDGDGIACE